MMSHQFKKFIYKIISKEENLFIKRNKIDSSDLRKKLCQGNKN